ncbi:hypothetical protein [uncultured Anaerococcus sp.]|uniref:hypothetical protein n=1 Tax=uncultured Anaerococcus sp. TaxID=293428 RepID=UPI0025FBE804|nr:hypothetical protein [uncultured Anaerococcus sp.]
MKKLVYLTLSAAMAFSLSACSSADAEVDTHIHHHDHASNSVTHEEHMVDDLETVDFMDKDFDMDKIEKRSCCDL